MERHAARHSWLIVLIVGVALFAIDERTMLRTDNPNFLPSVILLGAAVVPVAFVVFVYSRRLPFDVPSGTVMVTALVGGVIGSAVAGFLEFTTLRRLSILSLLGVGVIEEAAKLIVPLAVLLFLPYRRRVDGLLIGVGSAAGFAALETMGYAFVVLVSSHGRITELQNVLLVRGITSPAGHMAWTGVTAATLWAAANDGWSRRSLARFAGVFVGVSVLHASWDAVATLSGYIIVGGISLALLAYVTHRQGHVIRRPEHVLSQAPVATAR